VLLKSIILIFFLIPAVTGLIAQDLFINEIMSSNSSTLTDNDGDYSDWLEIYNAGTLPVNLAGYYLSDDVSNLNKWQFSEVEIDPGNFLIIFASGKDTSNASIHTNFKIASEGEWLILSDSQMNIIDSTFSGFMVIDISKGRQPDGSANWFFFTDPTPGSINNSIGAEATMRLDGPQFFTQGGFYDSQFHLIINTRNVNTSIFYTTDGSMPDTNATEYTDPVAINNTTVIKAVEIHESGLSGNVITHTYFINENKSLPVISLSLFPEDFEEIYRNHDLEKPVHIEMFDNSGELAFSYDAGAEVFGSGSTGFDQKSLSIFFRKEYGRGTLNYKLFQDLPYVNYESFILRNSGNDWWSTMFRDAMITNGLMEGTAVDYQKYRPVVVYINGEFWGIHNMREKVNEHYIKDHHFVSQDNLDMLEYKEEITPQIIHGDLNHYNDMIDFLKRNTLSKTENYEHIKSVIDIDNFIDYQVVEIYCANIDWPANNNKFWRSKDSDGKWRWILYDLDTGFGLWDEWWAYGTAGWKLDHIAHALSESNQGYEEAWPNPQWSTFIFRMLLENREFKNDFINRMADYLNSRFSPAHVLQKIQEFENRIKPVIGDHLERWDRYQDDYSYEVNKVEKFAKQRPEHVRSHLMTHFNLSGTAYLNLKIEPAGSGIIKLNSLFINSSTWQGIYFTDIPVSLTAAAAPGYKFKNWSNTSNSEPSISVFPNDGLTFSAFFEVDSNATEAIIINEINYNSSNDFDPGDWIELFNNGANEQDLSGWTIKDAIDSNMYVIPDGTILNSADYLVLCRDKDKFSNYFSMVQNYLGDLGFGITSDGDTLRLYNSNSILIDSVAFSKNEPWPYKPDGNGPTLELINPDLDNSLSLNWASSTILGTPGEINSQFDVSSVTSPLNPQTKKADRIQNFPNPSSDNTNFRFNLEHESHVQIKIYDLLGRQIKTVLDRSFSIGGEYTANWDNRSSSGSRLAKGIYFYVYKVNFEVVEIGKIIIL